MASEATQAEIGLVGPGVVILRLPREQWHGVVLLDRIEERDVGAIVSGVPALVPHDDAEMELLFRFKLLELAHIIRHAWQPGADIDR